MGNNSTENFLKQMEAAEDIVKQAEDNESLVKAVDRCKDKVVEAVYQLDKLHGDHIKFKAKLESTSRFFITFWDDCQEKMKSVMTVPKESVKALTQLHEAASADFSATLFNSTNAAIKTFDERSKKLTENLLEHNSKTAKLIADSKNEHLDEMRRLAREIGKLGDCICTPTMVAVCILVCAIILLLYFVISFMLIINDKSTTTDQLLWLWWITFGLILFFIVLSIVLHIHGKKEDSRSRW